MTEKDTKATDVNLDRADNRAPANKASKTHKESSGSNGWSFGSIFWGSLLVVIGILIFLNNVGLMQIHLGDLWRLWPLAVIGTGFSIMATKHWIWRILAVLFVVGTLSMVVLLGIGRFPVGEQNDSSSTVAIASRSDVREARIELSAGASKINIGAGTGGDIVKASLESDGLELSERTSIDGGVLRSKISTEKSRDRWFGPFHNEWDVLLGQDIPLSFMLDAGASSIDADLSELRLRNLEVDAGASSVDIKLGQKESNSSVKIDSGASSITLRIPKDAGVLLKFDGGLSGKSLADLKESGKDEYRSDNYDAASNKINIVVDAGLASFTIDRY